MKIQAYNNINNQISFTGKRDNDTMIVLYNNTPVNSLLPVKHPYAGFEEINLISVLGKKIKTLFSPEITKRAEEINKNLDAIVDSSLEMGKELNIQA